MSLNDVPEWAVGILISVLTWAANRVRKLFSDVDIAFAKIRVLEQKEKDRCKEQQ